jgi:hypothetical protein
MTLRSGEFLDSQRVGRNKPGVAFGHNQSGEPGGVSPRTLPDRNFVRPGG